MAVQPTTKTAMFAGGCFWCMQPAFDNIPGVVSTTVGYSGGSKETATYEQVSSGTTQHLEVIQVTYDPTQVSYRMLVDIYFENVDPTDDGGQFADRGNHYKTAIFYTDEGQKLAAEESKAAITAKFSPHPITVRVSPGTTFYAAEDYHQKYYAKNSMQYNAYKVGSGRAGFLEKMWGKKNAATNKVGGA